MSLAVYHYTNLTSESELQLNYNSILTSSCYETSFTGPDPGFSVGGALIHFGGVLASNFSVKMYAKMKELGPVGGVYWHAP